MKILMPGPHPKIASLKPGTVFSREPPLDHCGLYIRLHGEYVLRLEDFRIFEYSKTCGEVSKVYECCELVVK